MDAYTALAQITLGGVVGAAGQGIRVVVGFKKQYDEASLTGKGITDVTETSRLVVSLLIGLTIGAIAGILGVLETLGDGEITKSAIMTLLAIGYAGTDFIEGFMQRQMPSQNNLNKTPGNKASTALPLSAFQPTHPIAVWFFQLKQIQAEMKTINPVDTKKNCKDFSKQTLKELILVDTAKNELSRFCHDELDLSVPNDAFDDMAKSFFWFLERIDGKAFRRILQVFYDVGVKYNPALGQKTEDEVSRMTIDQVYGSEPFGSSPAKQELHKTLKSLIPTDFYPENGGPLVQGTRSVTEAINQIIV